MEIFSVPTVVRENLTEIHSAADEAYAYVQAADELLFKLRELAAYTPVEDELPEDVVEIFRAARRIEELSDTLHYELNSLLDDALVVLSHLSEKDHT